MFLSEIKSIIEAFLKFKEISSYWPLKLYQSFEKYLCPHLGICFSLISEKVFKKIWDKKKYQTKLEFHCSEI